MRNATLKKKWLEAKILAQLIEIYYYDKDKPVTLQEQIQSLITATKNSLEKETRDKLSDIIIDVEKINAMIKPVDIKKEKEVVDNLKKDIEKINANLLENQHWIDNYIKNANEQQDKNL